MDQMPLDEIPCTQNSALRCCANVSRRGYQQETRSIIAAAGTQDRLRFVDQFNGCFLIAAAVGARAVYVQRCDQRDVTMRCCSASHLLQHAHHRRTLAYGNVLSMKKICCSIGLQQLLSFTRILFHIQ